MATSGLVAEGWWGRGLATVEAGAGAGSCSLADCRNNVYLRERVAVAHHWRQRFVSAERPACLVCQGGNPCPRRTAEPGRVGDRTDTASESPGVVPRAGLGTGRCCVHALPCDAGCAGSHAPPRRIFAPPVAFLRRGGRRRFFDRARDGRPARRRVSFLPACPSAPRRPASTPPATSPGSGSRPRAPSAAAPPMHPCRRTSPSSGRRVCSLDLSRRRRDFLLTQPADDLLARRQESLSVGTADVIVPLFLDRPGACDDAPAKRGWGSHGAASA